MRRTSSARFGTTVTDPIDRDKIYNWTIGKMDPNVTGDTRERFDLRKDRRLGDIYQGRPEGPSPAHAS